MEHKVIDIDNMEEKIVMRDIRINKLEAAVEESYKVLQEHFPTTSCHEDYIVAEVKEMLKSSLSGIKEVK